MVKVILITLGKYRREITGTPAVPDTYHTPSVFFFSNSRHTRTSGTSFLDSVSCLPAHTTSVSGPSIGIQFVGVGEASGGRKESTEDREMILFSYQKKRKRIPDRGYHSLGGIKSSIPRRFHDTAGHSLSPSPSLM